MIVNLRIFHFLRPPENLLIFCYSFFFFREKSYILSSEKAQAEWGLRSDPMMGLICWFHLFSHSSRHPWKQKSNREARPLNKQPGDGERMAFDKTVLSFYYDGSRCCLIKPVPDAGELLTTIFQAEIFPERLKKYKNWKQEHTKWVRNNNAKFHA